MLCYINWNIDPIIFSLGSLGIRYYSLCWLIGFALGYYFIKKVFIKEKLDTELLWPLLYYTAIGALIGARLGHCIFYDWAYFSKHIIEIFLPIQITAHGIKFIGYTGLASHGGAIGVIIALILFSKKHKIPFLNLLDKIAFVTPIAGAFIRIGNFFNSEIIGGPANVAWAVIFQRVDSTPRHPAQLYEAFAYFIIFGILYYSYYKSTIRKKGFIFGLSISLIFIVRFLIEFYKEVQEPFELKMREAIYLDMGQLLSLPFIILGIYFIISRKNKRLKL